MNETSAPQGVAHPSRGERLAIFLGVHDAGRALRDFATYLPTRAIPAIAGFLALPILARRLFPTEIGVLSIDQTLITLGWTVIGAWLTTALVRELPAYRARNDLAGFERTLRKAIGLVLVGFALFTLLLVLMGLVSSAVGDYLPYIVAASLGLVLQNIAVSLFAAGLRPRAYAVVEVAARVGGLGLGVALVFAGYRVGGYLFGLAVGSTVIGFIGLVYAWPKPKRTSRGGATHVRTWLSYGIPASTGAITIWALLFVDRYILAILRNQGAVGVYTVGNIVGDRLVSIPLLAFIAGAGPLLMTAFERHGRAEVERLMRAYTRIILLVGFAAVAYVGAVAGRLIPALTGPIDYRAAVPVAPVVGLASVFFTLGIVTSTGLSVAKRMRPAAYASALGLGVNVAANFALVPPFGIMGSAVSAPLGMATYMFASHYWGRTHATWHFPYGTLVRSSLAAAAGYAVAVTMTHVTKGVIADLISAAVVGLIAYLAVLGLLGERRGGLPGAAH